MLNPQLKPKAVWRCLAGIDGGSCPNSTARLAALGAGRADDADGRSPDSRRGHSSAWRTPAPHTHRQLAAELGGVAKEAIPAEPQRATPVLSRKRGRVRCNGVRRLGHAPASHPRAQCRPCCSCARALLHRSTAFFGARRTGWLQKRGDTSLAGWKWRWFALHSGVLQYYDRPPALPAARLAVPVANSMLR